MKISLFFLKKKMKDQPKVFVILFFGSRCKLVTVNEYFCVFLKLYLFFSYDIIIIIITCLARVLNPYHIWFNDLTGFKNIG